MLLCTTLLSAQLADFGHTTPVGTFIMRGAPRMKWDWLLRNLDLPAQMLANFSSDLVSRKTTLAKVAENLSPCPSFSTDCALWDPGCLKQYGLCVLRFQHVGKCLGIDYSNANYFWMFLQHPQDKVQISYQGPPPMLGLNVHSLNSKSSVTELPMSSGHRFSPVYQSAPNSVSQ